MSETEKERSWRDSLFNGFTAILMVGGGLVGGTYSSILLLNYGGIAVTFAALNIKNSLAEGYFMTGVFAIVFGFLASKTWENKIRRSGKAVEILAYCFDCKKEFTDTQLNWIAHEDHNFAVGERSIVG